MVKGEQHPFGRRESDDALLELLTSISERVCHDLGEFKKQLSHLDEMLRDPETGLILLVDRLTEAEKRRTRLIGILIGAFSTQLAVFVVSAVLWFMKNAS